MITIIFDPYVIPLLWTAIVCLVFLGWMSVYNSNRLKYVYRDRDFAPIYWFLILIITILCGWTLYFKFT